MTIPERAKALVGDMPWVTESLTKAQIDDLVKQIATSMEQVWMEAYDQGILCGSMKD